MCKRDAGIQREFIIKHRTIYYWVGKFYDYFSAKKKKKTEEKKKEYYVRLVYYFDLCREMLYVNKLQGKKELCFS